MIPASVPAELTAPLQQSAPAPRRPRQPLAPWAEAIVLPLGAITVALLLFGLFVALAGASPLEVFFQMYRGAFGTWFSFQNTLLRAAPLMLTALCTALPARVGLVVIGGEGALVLGGLAASVAGLTFPATSPLVATALMMGAGFAAGGAWIALCGALRAFRGVNETISSLLLAYVAIALFNHFVEGPLRDPASLNKPSTTPLPESFMLTTLPGMDVHWGLVYGVVACVVAYVLFQLTTFGFSARMAGGNVRAAMLCGLRVPRLIVVVTFLAGGFAGLAGMVEVAAVHGTANASLVAGYGYTGILVAFMARHHPLAILPVSLLMGGISASGGLLQRTAGLPDAAVTVLQGLLFLVLLAAEIFRGRLRFGRRAPAGGAA